MIVKYELSDQIFLFILGIKKLNLKICISLSLSSFRVILMFDISRKNGSYLWLNYQIKILSINQDNYEQIQTIYLNKNPT